MKLEEYKKALSAAALGEEEEERLAVAVVKKLEKRRKNKRVVRRVLVPVLSAAVLCIVAVPLAFARVPAGAPDGSEPPAEEDPPAEDGLPEDPEARFPKRELSGDGNVTNRAAERFYRDHGVERIERGLDLSPTMSGRCVMRTAYCIRREIGACLREGTPLREELYLVRGARRYRLQFDCARCEMKLIDER